MSRIILTEFYTHWNVVIANNVISFDIIDEKCERAEEITQYIEGLLVIIRRLLGLIYSHLESILC